MSVKAAAERYSEKNLSPSITLAKHHKVNVNGQKVEGPLIADEKGIGVEATVTTKTGLTKRSVRVERYYVVRWADAKSYTIVPAAQNNFAGSTVNGGSVVVTITTTGTVWSVTLHMTSVPQVTNQLGQYLATIPA
jgi:hypothetical protein